MRPSIFAGEVYQAAQVKWETIAELLYFRIQLTWNLQIADEWY